MENMEMCANCGEVYAHHMQSTTQCYPDSVGRWFPKQLADALARQQRRIRRAQISLGKEHMRKVNTGRDIEANNA